MPTNPDFYDDKLPKSDEIRKALRLAVEKTLDQDYDLIALGGHEQAIAHRIAVYLERSFPDFHTDCEYNRQKHKTKNRHPETPNSKKKMRPDIIVHRRNTSRNVLAVEMKAEANPESEDDLVKLASLKGEGTYLYKGAAFVTILNDIDMMAEGVLRATIAWYSVTNYQPGDQPTEQVGYRANLKCDKHVAEVKEIVAKRKAREPRRRK
jgi:hypothetical protein